MPVFENWLKNPLQIINNVFSSDPLNFETKIQEYFEEKLKSEKNYYSIPCLNDAQLHELTPNCLVRYRCMIQDSFDPVYYTYVQELKNKENDEKMYMTLKYKETLDFPENYEPTGNSLRENLLEVLKMNSGDSASLADEAKLKEKTNNLHQRLTYYCVPVPGETEWVKGLHRINAGQHLIHEHHSNSSCVNNNSSKRGVDTESANGIIVREEVTDSTVSNIFLKFKSTSLNTKQAIEGENENVKLMSTNQSTMVSVDSTDVQVNIAKKTKTEEVKETKISLDNEGFNLNFPLASTETGMPSLVKVYDDLENLKINDIVEFIGVLSFDPSLAYQPDEHHPSDPMHGFEGYEIVSELDEDISESISANLNEKNEREQQLDQVQRDAINEVICSSTTIGSDSKTQCLDIKLTKVHTKHNKRMILSQFPPSLVPRLHAIKVVNLVHVNPLIHRDLTLPVEHEKESKESKNSFASVNAKYWNTELDAFFRHLINDPSATNNCKSIVNDSVLFSNAQMHLYKLRKEIINIFQQLLLDDGLAAEYLLMHFLSNIFLRKDVTTLGKFCLNITNVPKPIAGQTAGKSFAECFYSAIKQLFTMGHFYKLTVANLNKTNMIPSKDYNKNKLITGMLQLPENFNLIIDETSLETGKLDTKGLMNFNSIKDVITWQKLQYDFSYHQQDFYTNIKVLTLSETKSILPCDFQIKLNVDVDKFDSETYEQTVKRIFESSFNLNLLNNIRKYLTILSHIDYKLSEQMQKVVEEDIVNIRTDTSNANNLKKKEKLGIDDFHLFLVVARLQTFSYGKGELSLHEWNRAKSLEFERLNRRAVV